MCFDVAQNVVKKHAAGTTRYTRLVCVLVLVLFLVATHRFFVGSCGVRMMHPFV